MDTLKNIYKYSINYLHIAKNGGSSSTVTPIDPSLRGHGAPAKAVAPAPAAAAPHRAESTPWRPNSAERQGTDWEDSGSIQSIYIYIYIINIHTIYLYTYIYIQ